MPGDFTSPMESALSSSSKTLIINLFDVIAIGTGRLCFVIPDSYGTVTDLEDNTDSSVLSQFNIVVDAVNSRKFYVSINAVTAATYKYKFIFA